MVVQIEREEEEVVGVDLQTTRRRSQSQSQSHHTKKVESPTTSDSSVTSESSDTSFEYFVTMNMNDSNNNNTNIGEKPNIVEDRSAIKEAGVEKEANFEEPKNEEIDINANLGGHEKGIINGLSVQPDDAGDKEMVCNKSPDTAVGLKYVESLLDESSSNAENMTVNKFLKSGQNVEIGLSKEADDEYDVEGVIQKQETHDLICPNCKTCITKRVILQRRKRKLPEISPDEEPLSPRPGPSDNQLPPEAPHAPVDAITCFSCFNIFIPTGNGFLFWKFGQKPDISLQPDGTSTGITPGEIAPPTAQPSLPTSPDGEPPRIDATPYDGRGKGFPLWILSCCQPYRLEHPEKPDETVPMPDGKHPSTTPDAIPVQPPPKFDSPITPDDGNEVPSHEFKPSLVPSDDIPDIPLSVPPKPEPPITPDPSTPLPPKPEPPATSNPGMDVRVEIPSDSKPPTRVSLTVIDPLDDPPAAKPKPDIEASLLTPPPERPRSGVSGLDIIKAIVYGGLLECISSLSVIASAAAGDASTLNVVALGMANVFGGIFLLANSLRKVKYEHTTEHYEAQLGRPGHFMLHATVAVISYLVFGLMPPLVYGFSFRKSDDKDLKLATLSAASLVCIILLSTGKAYVRTPPKAYIQTIFYYVSVGVSVSGIGYVAGHFVNMLLEKLHVFDTSSSIQPATVKGAWSSF